MAEVKTNNGIPGDGATSARLGESEFLRVEAEQAKAAVKRALEDAKTALTGAVDPRELTRSHPFVALGSAVVAGFVAAAVAIPSKEQQALRRIEKLQRAMHPSPPPSNGSGATGNGSTTETKPPAPSFLAMIVKEIIAVLKPILIAAITANLNPPPAPPVAPASPDGTFDGTGPITGPDNPR